MNRAGSHPLVIFINIFVNYWFTSEIFFTGVLLYTKMLKKNKETIGFVVIIFIICGISIGMAPFPGYTYGAEQVDASQMHHQRWSPPEDFCDFSKKK